MLLSCVVYSDGSVWVQRQLNPDRPPETLDGRFSLNPEIVTLQLAFPALVTPEAIASAKALCLDLAEALVFQESQEAIPAIERKPRTTL